MRILKLLWCHRGATGLLGLAGTGLNHVNVGSCSGEEDEDEWPDLERLIGVWPRDVCSTIGEICCRADTPLRNRIFQPSERIVFGRKGTSGHVGRSAIITLGRRRSVVLIANVIEDRHDFISSTPVC